MLVALHKGTGFIAKAIQWQTRSVYSHASLVLSTVYPGARVIGIEAREFKGVRKVDWLVEYAEADVDLFEVKGLTRDQELSIERFAFDQIGKPYDYTMVARFISRRQAAREESGKWFCSELVFYCFYQCGINLLDRIEPWAVSPGLLSLSPLLIPVKQGKDGFHAVPDQSNQTSLRGGVGAMGNNTPSPLNGAPVNPPPSVSTQPRS